MDEKIVCRKLSLNMPFRYFKCGVVQRDRENSFVLRTITPLGTRSPSFGPDDPILNVDGLDQNCDRLRD